MAKKATKKTPKLTKLEKANENYSKAWTKYATAVEKMNKVIKEHRKAVLKKDTERVVLFESLVIARSMMDLDDASKALKRSLTQVEKAQWEEKTKGFKLVN